MDATGGLASMNFPTMAGFNARPFNEAPDKECSLVMLQAYNDWHLDEWCGSYPGRFIPPGHVTLWAGNRAVAGDAIERETRIRHVVRYLRSIALLPGPAQLERQCRARRRRACEGVHHGAGAAVCGGFAVMRSRRLNSPNRGYFAAAEGRRPRGSRKMT